MRLDATAALQRPGSLVYKLGILPGSMSLEATHRPGIVNAGVDVSAGFGQ